MSEIDVGKRARDRAEAIEAIEAIENPEEIDYLQASYRCGEAGNVTEVTLTLTLTVGGPLVTVDLLAQSLTVAWAGDTHTTHFRNDAMRDFGATLAHRFEQRID